MSRPAIIFITAESSPRVAGLEVLDRLIVGLHRAGCAPITLVGPERALPDRSAALGIAVEHRSAADPINAPCLVAGDQGFACAADLAALEPGERLDFIAAGCVERWEEPSADDLWETLEGLDSRKPTGPAAALTRDFDLLEAERAVWASLASSADGIFDKALNRPLGRLLTRALVKTPISPNQVSLIALGVGLGGAACFIPGDHSWAIAGALIFQLSAVIDCVDGELARVLFKESALGRWLDIGADQVVHIAIFLGVAAGMSARGAGEVAAWLGGSAALGALLSFAVVLRGLLTPEDQRHPRLQNLIDAVATRDFSIMLLVLTLIDRTDWFLWIIATGIHIFWLGALVIQVLARSATTRAPS